MKKILILSGLFLCLGLTVSAQRSNVSAHADQKCSDPAKTNKRGISILPKAGDFAIGIDATPFFEYLGNSFNNTTGNQAPFFNGVDNTVYGKYFLENDRAIRAKLRFNIGQDTYKGVVPDDVARASSPLLADATGIDKLNLSGTDIELRAGYEWRRGRGRVQGFWGGEAGIGFMGGKSKYKYANAITATNLNPSTWNFADVNPGVIRPASRVLSAKMGTTIYGTVAAFAGVEYFFAPNISLGGELNIGLVFASRGKDKVITESWDAVNTVVKKQTSTESSWTESPSGVTYLVAAGESKLLTRTTGQIFVMFHF